MAGNWATWLGSVFLAWLGAAIVLLAGETIASRLGPRGMIALERLVGMLLVAIAARMFLSGVEEYILSLQPPPVDAGEAEAAGV